MNNEEDSRQLLGSVSVWLRALPSGKHEAQNQLLSRYREQVVNYARFRLKRIGVRAVDADDIAQEVFIGLFRRAGEGQFDDLDDRNQLWRKLARITNDRVIDARRKRVEATQSALQQPGESNAINALNRLEDSDIEACFLMVEHALLQRDLQDRHPQLPEIARLKILGLSVTQISKALSTPKRTIERRLEWINQLCEDYCKD